VSDASLTALSDTPPGAEAKDGLRLRDAKPDDLATIDGLVRALARYERLEHEAVATTEQFREALFGPAPKVFALICEWQGQPVGLCIWFYNFSTFLGRHGIYIEDIYVEPEFRGRGIGREVFRHLARRALAEGCGRIEWQVLNWNEPAISFYEGIGAIARSDWHTRRIAGEALEALAQDAQKGGSHG
jgi:GNAT superfamily N-acetyltransferase